MSNWAALFRSLTADNVDNADNVEAACASPADNVNKVNNVRVSKGEEGEATTSPLVSAFAALERRCPDHIEAADWQHAVEDGRRFLLQWGEQAERLGWIESDAFGLPSVPANPHPSWRRLARVDRLGLVWLAHGRPVTSITAESATIATPGGGSLAFYRPRAHREAQGRLDARCARPVMNANDPNHGKERWGVRPRGAD